MKKIFTLALSFMAFAEISFAQAEMDAFNLSYNDLTGTARSVSMGGAFGALGGDASGVAINPAGIGVYKSYEIITTMNFTNTKTTSSFTGIKTDDSKFKFNFDNIAFIGVLPIESDEVPLINFGFAYNKLKSFDRKVSMRGAGLNSSLSDYAAIRANRENDFDNIANGDKYNGDWLSILSYDGNIITKNPNGTNSFVSILGENQKVDNGLNIREKGEISTYDFNVGTTISDFISIGATISVTDIYYKLSSDYYENFNEAGKGEGFNLMNQFKTEGAGWQVKTGVILKPFKELRIGAAYHSPTWYKMTDYYYGAIDYKINNINTNKIEKGYAETPSDALTDYEFRTPDKWTFSIAGIIGQYAIISADYELTNYSKMNLSNRYIGDYNYDKDNQEIKTDFKNSAVLRVGAEIRFTPQFSGRVGYMWQESPLEKDFKNGSREIYTARTVPHYTLVGDSNYYTWGLGYRFTPNFYTDVAFVIKNQKADLYSFSNLYDENGETVVNSVPAELKTNQFTGLLTLGYKF